MRQRVQGFHSQQRLLLRLAVQTVVHLVPELEGALLHRVEAQDQPHEVLLQRLAHSLLCGFQRLHVLDDPAFDEQPDLVLADPVDGEYPGDFEEGLDRPLVPGLAEQVDEFEVNGLPALFLEVLGGSDGEQVHVGLAPALYYQRHLCGLQQLVGLNCLSVQLDQLLEQPHCLLPEVHRALPIAIEMREEGDDFVERVSLHEFLAELLVELELGLDCLFHVELHLRVVDFVFPEVGDEAVDWLQRVRKEVRQGLGKSECVIE